METCPDIAKRILELPESERSGSLRIYGEWFGRPMDNVHRCVSCKAVGDRIVLGFDGGETLTVWDPDGLLIQKQKLTISRATRVQWEWYYYGKPQTRENLFYLDYRVEGGKLSRDTNEPWADPSSAHTRENAVELFGK